MTAQSCIFRDVLVVPPLGEAPFAGWVAVADTTIAAVGRGAPEPRADQRVIEGNGAALLPGFVNTHAHSHSSLTRGSAEGLPLERSLAVIEQEQAQLTDEQAYIGGLATYAEALLSGTTTIVDMCLRPEPAMAAAREIGIRAVIVPYVADTKPFAPSLRDNARLLETGERDGRVQLWVGVHDLESCSDDCIRAAGELARKHHTGLHLHCAETRASVDRTVSRVGRTPVAQLHALAALSERTLLAHCVWLSEEDRALIAAAGAHVAHCPHANLKLGSGIAPVPDLCRRGVNVTLATDGAKANNRLDMLDVMKFASLLHKGVSGDPSVLPPDGARRRSQYRRLGNAECLTETSWGAEPQRKDSGDLPIPSGGGSRMPCELWHHDTGPLCTRRRPDRQAAEGSKAGRFASPATDKVRAGNQPQIRQGARPHHVATTASPRRRGD
jgi:cytosine/adenosine deaminase-related metal-dependent hydrolase